MTCGGEHTVFWYLSWCKTRREEIVMLRNNSWVCHMEEASVDYMESANGVARGGEFAWCKVLHEGACGMSLREDRQGERHPKFKEKTEGFRRKGVSNNLLGTSSPSTS